MFEHLARPVSALVSEAVERCESSLDDAKELVESMMKEKEVNLTNFCFLAEILSEKSNLSLCQKLIMC